MLKYKVYIHTIIKHNNGDRMSILDRHEDRNSYSRAFTTAEMLLVLVIISFLILAIPPLIHKKFEKQLSQGNHGRYECWRDTNGHVYEFLATNKRGIIKHSANVEPNPNNRNTLQGANLGENGVCHFSPDVDAPGASYFSIQAVGGGAGGAMAPKAIAEAKLEKDENDVDAQSELKKYTGTTIDSREVILGANSKSNEQNISWTDNITKYRVGYCITTDKKCGPVQYLPDKLKEGVSYTSLMYQNADKLSSSDIGQGDAIFSYTTSLNHYNEYDLTKWVAAYFPDVLRISVTGMTNANANDIIYCSGHGNRGEAIHTAQYTYNAAKNEYQIHINFLEGQKGGRQKCYKIDDHPIIRTHKKNGDKYELYDNNNDDDKKIGFTFKIPNEHMLWASNLNLFLSDRNVKECTSDDNPSVCKGPTNSKKNRFDMFRSLNILDTNFEKQDDLLLNSDYDNNIVKGFAHFQGCYKGKDGLQLSSQISKRANYCNLFNGATDDVPGSHNQPNDYIVNFTIKVPVHDNLVCNNFNNCTTKIPKGWNDWYKWRNDAWKSTTDWDTILDELKTPDISNFQAYWNSDMGYIFNFRGAPKSSSGSSYKKTFRPYLESDDRGITNYPQKHFYSMNRNISVRYIDEYNLLNQVSSIYHNADEHEIMKKYLASEYLDKIKNETPDIEFTVSHINGSKIIDSKCKIIGGKRGVAANLETPQNPNLNTNNDSELDSYSSNCNLENGVKKFNNNKTDNNPAVIIDNKPFAFMRFVALNPKTQGNVESGDYSYYYASPYYGYGSLSAIKVDTKNYNFYQNAWIIDINDEEKRPGGGNDSNYGLRMNTDAAIYEAASMIFPRKIVMKRGYRYDSTTYGFAGDSGQKYSMMLSNLTGTLELTPGRGGTAANEDNDYEPQDGENTILWAKKTGTDGACNSGNTNCRQILTARGGSANKGGAIGEKMILLGDNTSPTCNEEDSNKNDVDKCYSKGAKAAEAPMRFSTSSGFTVIQEFDKKTKTPSALAQYNSQNDNPPGTGGNGGYTFITNNSGFEEIWSGDCKCLNGTESGYKFEHQGNSCKHTNLTAAALRALTGVVWAENNTLKFKYDKDHETEHLQRTHDDSIEYGGDYHCIIN